MERTKKVKTITIYSFVLEIQEWVDFTPTELNLAKDSRIDTKTGPYFASLIRGYKRGEYDEDMNVLGDAIKSLLRRKQN